MFNQSFTTENFREIFDRENRKGHFLEREFFPEIEAIVNEIKTYKVRIRQLHRKEGSLSKEYFQEEKLKLKQKKAELTTEKETLLTAALQKVAADIAGKSLSLGLTRGTAPNGKPIYVINSEPSAYFAIKQIQQNVRELYDVKQSNRHQIICQLSQILNDSFPKYVIRTDMQDFYESLSSDKLLKILDGDAYLTLPTRALIRKILEEYRIRSGNKVGLPRGVGVSAYLAELYIRGFDRAVKAHRDVIFYARYVDDVVVVFSPRPNSSVNDLLPFVKDRATAESLTLNDKKTKCFDCSESRRHHFEYLGYKFTFGCGPTTIGLSRKRMEKYRSRIDLAISEYKAQSAFREKKARSLLVKRVQFLTGNTRLNGNKRNIMVGMFHSNSSISNTNELRALDKLLKARIESIGLPSLKKRLSTYSFEDGFAQRTYRTFSSTEFTKIVDVWKHETKT